MTDALKDYKAIANPEYINNIEENLYIFRYAELCQEMDAVERERDRDRLKLILVSDIWGEGHILYETLTSYLLAEYKKLEDKARSYIYDAIFSILDENKQKVFVKNIVSELLYLQKEIDQIEVSPKNEVYKTLLLEKVSAFAMSLQEIYFQKKISNQSDKYANSKIKWLGTNKQLGTLFFDLWKGQKGTTQNLKGFKPIIEVETKEQLMNFLFNNFENKKGEPLSLISLSDQLNESESKNNQRANDNRIELSY